MFSQKDSLTKSEELEQILKDIEQIGDIQASIIVSKNGLMMVSNCTDSVDANIIGAMVAMLIRSATNVIKELEKEDLEYLLLHTKSGEILVMNVCSNAILCVMTDKHKNSGLTVVEMKKAGEKIKNILGE
ncbi:MAG: roadblock/LC7 domain-containing protein [ANME-2 cluster archaeon]|nr:roadblock/LC7 domain-containing protein [ANME-2 cluster archaeon]